MDQPAEMIQGERLGEMVQALIDSRRICKMEIPETSYSWITLLIGAKKAGSSNYLLVDGVTGFEEALSLSNKQEVVLDFSAFDGVPCHFQTAVIKCLPKEIWVEFPEAIYRVQKRAYYRLEAPAGAEISYQVENEKEKKARIRDYSLGGVAFLIHGEPNLKPGHPVKNIRLRLPQGQGWITVHIPLAVVRRVEQGPHPLEALCALEFLQISDTTREQLGKHIFEKQRSFIRKFR